MASAERRESATLATWLVTGVAGFIGAHVASSLLRAGERVVGCDTLDPYYSPALKQRRLAEVVGEGLDFRPTDVADASAIAALFAEVEPERVIHLAAQPGVRHATVDYLPYANVNLTGFVNVAELSARHAVDHLVFASSSSVYGETSATPFSVHDPTSHPVSLYAATKRANELIAHSYSHLHSLPTTGLRFFTAYGPWGRPDMAYWSFARAILQGSPLRIFGDGSALRDFTHIDDVVRAVVAVAGLPPAGQPSWDAAQPDPASSLAPFRLLNVGRGEQITVSAMIDVLEEHLGRPADRVHEGRQGGDVTATHADVSELHDLVGFRPTISSTDGLARFCEWYLATPFAQGI